MTLASLTPTTVLLIGGPTATGKSALACDVAETWNGTVINADSMQIYRELPLLTAQPTATDRARAAHELYGVLKGSEVCSVARWRQMAISTIESTLHQNKLPIVVGGTGLYFKALTEGIAAIPDVPELIRQIASARRDNMGADRFHADLATRDPETAQNLNPGDTQRTLRAWSVHEFTGRPLSAWQKDTPLLPPAHWAFRWIVLDPPRDVLYATCDARLERMIRDGALTEVEHLIQGNVPPDLPVMKAVGVQSFARHLKGELPLDKAVEEAQRLTRNYAKRQRTWFQHQVVGAWPDQLFPGRRLETFYTRDIWPSLKDLL